MLAVLGIISLLVVAALPAQPAAVLAPITDESMNSRSNVIPMDSTNFAPFSEETGSEYVPGELLVAFRPGIAASRAEVTRKALGAVAIEEFSEIGVQHWRLPAGLQIEKAIWGLSANPNVLYAEPNYILHAHDFPNDSLRNNLWGLHNIGQTGGTMDADIDALEAWAVQTGSSTIVVGDIDSGIDYNHEDLSANIWTNPGEIPDNGVDDDNNGFIDDVRGWDFVNDDNDPIDDFGHGTHTAGTIGAEGNNGVGVVGVNWNVQIMSIKFLNSGGRGSTDDAIASINYAASFEDESGNKIVRITSNSWGGGRKSRALEDAIANSGALFVAAAGNGGNSKRNYPAACPLENIISVAATDHNDDLASFSSFGPDWVDLAAPGVDILSTYPDDTYRPMDGTSMSAPHVSGVAALIMANDESLSNAAVKTAILDNVDLLPSLDGKVLTGGRLNARAALGASEFPADTAPPAAITNLAVDGIEPFNITLSWTATADDGSDPASGPAYLYDVRYLVDETITEGNWENANQAEGEPVPQSPGSSESYTISGLVGNTTYYLALKVADDVGNFCALSNVVTATTEPSPSGWSNVIVESTGDVGRFTSIAVDSSGNPYISYHDESNGHLKLARWTGSAWVTEVVAEAGLGKTSLALDTSGNPRIVYEDGNLKYARWTGSSWQIETVDSGGSASLALDASDNPHISYHKHSGQDSLNYAKWTGSSWVTEIVERGKGGVGKHSSIAMDASGNPHIGYQGSKETLKYARWTGSAWDIQEVDKAGWPISLALDASGNPHISHCEFDENDLKYSHWTGSAWVTEVLDSECPYCENSLAVDASGNPHISYYQGLDGDLNYAQWTGAMWEIEVVDFQGYVGIDNSLALDASGGVHISHYDGIERDLKYAHKEAA